MCARLAVRPYRQGKSGIVLALWVTPKAQRDEICGVQIRDDDRAVLRVRVTAPPDKGQANKALIALLAKSLHLPKAAFSLVSGQTGRLKSVAIAGEPDQITAGLKNLLARK